MRASADEFAQSVGGERDGTRTGDAKRIETVRTRRAGERRLERVGRQKSRLA
jgi:hypothetical protein